MKQFIITAQKGNHSQIVFGPSSAMLCGFKKKELISSGNWRGWELVLRCPKSYKQFPILGKQMKPLTYDQKISKLKL